MDGRSASRPKRSMRFVPWFLLVIVLGLLGAKYGYTHYLKEEALQPEIEAVRRLRLEGFYSDWNYWGECGPFTGFSCVYRDPRHDATSHDALIVRVGRRWSISIQVPRGEGKSVTPREILLASSGDPVVSLLGENAEFPSGMIVSIEDSNAQEVVTLYDEDFDGTYDAKTTLHTPSGEQHLYRLGTEPTWIDMP